MTSSKPENLMSRFLSTCALLGALLSSPAASASNGDIDAMTLLGDWRGRIGQTIGISGCTLVSAIPHLVICLVKSKHGHPDSFLVDTSAMAADDLARALRDCGSYVGYPICRVRLEGEVGTGDGELKIMHGSVSWTYPPR